MPFSLAILRKKIRHFSIREEKGGIIFLSPPRLREHNIFFPFWRWFERTSSSVKVWPRGSSTVPASVTLLSQLFFPPLSGCLCEDVFISLSIFFFFFFKVTFLIVQRVKQGYTNLSYSPPTPIFTIGLIFLNELSFLTRQVNQIFSTCLKKKMFHIHKLPCYL